MKSDTIIAISTPPGQGGMAVIRISGPESIGTASRFFKGRELLHVETHRAVHGWIRKDNNILDEVVIVVFKAPDSYTGEDVVEISCHGSMYVATGILELFTSSGVRSAEPGEFTMRAFLNGRMDLSQAEAVADLIHARSEASRKVAINQLRGSLSSHLESMREELIRICSMIEVELDFGEEQIEFIPREELLRSIQKLRHQTGKLIHTYERGKLYRAGVKVAILGKPNVGKSSLFNAIIKKNKAIVTDIPGTTRDTVEGSIDLNGILFTFTDTAGIRKTDEIIEKEGIARTLNSMVEADILILVIDGSQDLTKDDMEVVSEIAKMEKPVVAAINKSDLPSKINVQSLKAFKIEAEAVFLSAVNGSGMNSLAGRLQVIAFSDQVPDLEEVVLTRMRHKDRLVQADRYLELAENSTRDGVSQEFIALDIQGALNEIGSITGHVTSEEILNKIFSEFCIGK